MAGGLVVLCLIGLAAFALHAQVALHGAGCRNVLENGGLVHRAVLEVEVISSRADEHPAGLVFPGEEVHLLAARLVRGPAGVVRRCGLAADGADEGLVQAVKDEGVAVAAGVVVLDGERVHDGTVQVIGRHGQLAAGRVHEQVERLIALADLGKVESGIVHGGVVDVAGLFAHIAADDIGRAVFGDFAAGQLLGAGIGMIVAGEDNVDPGGIDRGGENAVIGCARALGVCVVWRLVDRQELPFARRLCGILLQPGGRCVQVCIAVHHGDVDIAVFHGVVVRIGCAEDIHRMTATQVAVVFMVAEDLHDGGGGEIFGEDVQNLVPCGQAASIVNEVTRLDAEVRVRVADGLGDLMYDLDIGGISLDIAAELRVAHDEERRLCA